MSALLGIVAELSPTDKVPGAYVAVKFGVGAASSGPPKYLLIVGMIGTGSTIVPDAAPVPIFSDTDADLYWGTGSEGAIMAQAALTIGGIQILGASATMGTSAQATAILTLDGTAGPTSGSWSIRVAGRVLNGGILATDTPQKIAQNIAAAVTANPRLPVTAVAAAGAMTTWTVTFTVKSAGVRGNDTILWQDKSGLPANITTSTLTGGAAVGNGGIRFSSGTGTEDITSLLTSLFPGRYYRIAAAQRDATNAARWAVQLDTKAGPLEMRSEHLVLCTSTTLSAAGSLAQTTIDDQRVELLWMQDSEAMPSEIAAEHAALRCQLEQAMPNRNYDNVQIKVAAAQTDTGTIPNRATLVAALDFGLTPLKTVGTSVLIVRAMTTRTRTSTGLVDTGTIDVADSAVADDVRDVLTLYWTTDFAVANPFLQDNPAPEDNQRPRVGIAYPDLWSAKATTQLKALEALNWLTKVDQNPVVSILSPYAVTPRIVFYAPCIRLPHQHQIEGTVAQTVSNPQT